MSVAFGSNLVLNPGAETWSGVANGYSIITPADWSAGGDPTIAQYHRFYGPVVDISEPDGSGKAFFTGGPDRAATNFSQTISLSSISGQIDAGQINFGLAGAVGGFSDFNDNAQVYVIFRNAAGTEISAAVTGNVLASDRNNATKLLYRNVNGTVPALTRSAQVQIQFNRTNPVTGYNHAYADNIRFVVYTNTQSTAGITPAVIKSTLPTTGISGLKIPGGVDLTLTNTSTSQNIGAGTVSLFASRDGVVDSNSVLLVKVKQPFSFGANQIRQLDIPLKTLDVPAGTYTIFAQTTDQYGNVDTATAGPSIVVVPQTVSLSAAVGPVSPATVKAGAIISFTLTLENSGNVNSTGLASIAIGLSSNGSVLARSLTTITQPVTVRSGDRPAPLHLKVKIPAGITGSFFPLVTFTQGANSVTAVGALPVIIGV